MVGAATDDEGAVAILSLQETDHVLFDGPAADSWGSPSLLYISTRFWIVAQQKWVKEACQACVREMNTGSLSCETRVSTCGSAPRMGSLRSDQNDRPMRSKDLQPLQTARQIKLQGLKCVLLSHLPFFPFLPESPAATGRYRVFTCSLWQYVRS